MRSGWKMNTAGVRGFQAKTEVTMKIFKVAIEIIGIFCLYAMFIKDWKYTLYLIGYAMWLKHGSYGAFNPLRKIFNPTSGSSGNDS